MVRDMDLLKIWTKLRLNIVFLIRVKQDLDSVPLNINSHLFLGSMNYHALSESI